MQRSFHALGIGLSLVITILSAHWAAAGGFERVAPPARTCNSEQDCLPIGVWNRAAWMTPMFPQTCQPLFASGALLGPRPPEPVTVILLGPLPQGKPKEPPPQRPITDEPSRPRRPRPDLEEIRPGDGSGEMPRGNLSRIHLLLLIDNEAKGSGKAHAAGADLIVQLFKNGIRGDRIGAIVRLDTLDLRVETINRRLQEIAVKPDDTLLVYYSGAAQFNEAAMSIMLTPSNQQQFPRDELRKMAANKGARLTLILSDSAEHPEVAEPARKAETPDPGPAGLEKLFFGWQGIVDIHGSSAGEFAAARGNQGGCFTQAIVREFGRPTGSWADMLESVKFSTNNLFKAYRLEVLKSDAVQPAAKALYRNQESQIPTQMTPIDNLKPAAPAGGGSAPAEPPAPADAPPEPATKLPIAPARIFLRVPEQATLLIDGQPTRQAGGERAFETPPLNVLQPQYYDLRLELGGWVGVYRIEVRGGATIMADLQVPQPVVAAP